MNHRWLKTAGIIVGSGLIVAIAALLLNLITPKTTRWQGLGALLKAFSFPREDPTPQPTDPSPPTVSASPTATVKVNPLDYSQLKTLLASGQFKAADRETQQVLEVWLEQQEQRTILESESESELRFSCIDLRNIDQLWLQASNGKFGFSVQKRLWQDAEQLTQEFGTRVGWYADEKWLQYNDLAFDVGAPVGHLPAAAWNAWNNAETDKDLYIHWFYLVFLSDRSCEE